MVTADGYVILDRGTGQLWRTPSGKFMWSKKNHASNAWAAHRGGSIHQQTRYIVRPVRFVDMETGDYLT